MRQASRQNHCRGGQIGVLCIWSHVVGGQDPSPHLQLIRNIELVEGPVQSDRCVSS